MTPEEKVADDVYFYTSSKCPWMWSDELPQDYTNTRAILYEIRALPRFPVPLRGSREVMYFSQPRRYWAARKFAERAAKMYRLNGAQCDIERKEAVIKINRAIAARWPSCRQRVEFCPGRHYVEGVLVDDPAYVFAEQPGAWETTVVVGRIRRELEKLNKLGVDINL